MGHYRQWLQYREIDQHLHTHLSELEQEMARLQQEANDLELNLSLSDNEIMQALVGQYKAQALIEALRVERSMHADVALPANGLVEEGATPLYDGTNGVLPAYASENGADALLPHDLAAEDQSALLAGGSLLPSIVEAPFMAPVSPALFGWSNLTDFDEEQVPITLSSVPTLPAVHPEPNLLPDDMLSFLHMHTRNSAPFPTPYAVPWWASRNAGSAPDNLQERGPVDQQSMRTDRLIQRWRERWGRIPASPHDAHRPQPQR